MAMYIDDKWKNRIRELHDDGVSVNAIRAYLRKEGYKDGKVTIGSTTIEKVLKETPQARKADNYTETYNNHKTQVATVTTTQTNYSLVREVLDSNMNDTFKVILIDHLLTEK